MSSEHDGIGPKYTALQVGVVTRNDDPLKLGRVRVRIAGLIEPESDWALPLGGLGAGSLRRGFYDPPDVGAEVAVFFHGGDVDRPYFLASNWGVPNGVRETPGPVGGYATPQYDTTPGTPPEVTAEEAPRIKAYETAKWVMVFDDRDGHEAFYVENKASGDHIKLLGAPRFGCELSITGTLRLKGEGQVVIESSNVTVNDRVVLPSSKPIS
jgi:uncharacterized protein involved in type VI secretion and phage assembly